MPDSTFYEGLNLAEQIARFNEHHHDPFTRHISKFESQMLDKVADAVSAPPSRSSRSNGGARVVLVLVGLAGLGAAGLSFIRRRKQEAAGHEIAGPAAAPTDPDGDASTPTPPPESPELPDS